MKAEFGEKEAPLSSLCPVESEGWVLSEAAFSILGELESQARSQAADDPIRDPDPDPMPTAK